MNVIRRRLGHGEKEEDDSSQEDSPRPITPEGDAGRDYKLVPAKHLSALKIKRNSSKGNKRRFAWVFILGGLFGLLVAAYFANNSDLIDIASFADLSLEPLLDVLPSAFLKEAREFQRHEKETVAYDSFAVGLAAQADGINASHPVVMIPGVISTGLESWGTEETSRQYFRKRLWGSWSMMRALVMDKTSWKRHIMLDEVTGLDPPGIKLRAAQGFDATDFFITGYWIWNKILENLATIGYDPTNAFTAAYDWRLAYADLEVRDQYFTRLKMHIELAVRIQGKKAVLLSHSMGSQVLYYFLHWVEEKGHGNGGSTWVEDNIDSWINISGCMLGTAKGLPAVLSGEMRDTAQLNAFAVYGLEKFLGRQERADIFRAMPGISSMIPIGGEAIWGNATWAPDDKPGQEASYGPFIRFRHPGENATTSYANLTVPAALPFVFGETEDWFKKMITRSYSHGVAHTKAEVDKNQKLPNKWINPLETRLPFAPNLKIYCFYGVGKPTERAYVYRADTDPFSKLNVSIDTSYSSVEHDIDRGVLMGEGDGTVNLISMGYMCSRGWKMKRYNPAGAKIKVFEMPHEPDRFSARGGPNTGDHVDILGRSSLNDLILRVAGGKGDMIMETISSDILEYAKRVPIYDDDEKHT
ncbi:Phospholipid:diacylglycerol acyltransferase [Microthyrium microscopicum]|uniref:Phospholipid:diacylglycerol acyltransferase n=1 Tax=Microthyrium microscopicum TaxID=703497 RepID=A0A6A6UJD2_9PEZI|nr:Phospholipid:diacylglycerol acyltransferase [Microthyrium microscopicum]